MQPKGLLKFLKLEGFVHNVSEYVENRIAIAKLEAKQKVADIGSTIAALVPAALFGLFAFMFLSLTLAQALNVWLDSRVWGFLIVGVLYLIVAYVMFLQRDAEWLKKKIVDGSTKFLKEKPQRERADQQATADYQAGTVEHKKVIFEEVEEETVSVTTAATDRNPLPHTPEDREPVSSADIAEASKASSNASIVVHTEEDTDKEPRV